MVAPFDAGEMTEDLRRLAGALDRIPDGPGAEDLSSEAARLAAMVRGYLLPRLEGRAGPVVVVFAGPTGSGKSTLVNTLAGSDVSRVGALRPTTMRPVALTAPRHASRYQTIGDVDSRVVIGNASFLESMTLVDTPDLDSTEIEHRAAAETVIDHADVVVFVTSAARYADEAPWTVLRRAVARGAPVVNVLNRVTSRGSGAMGDFRARLAAEGLDDDLVIVAEHEIGPNAQRLPALAVRSLWARLQELVAIGDEDAADRRDRVLRSVMGQVARILERFDAIAGDLGAVEAHLSTRLADRVAGLDLAGVGHGLHSPPPSGGRRSAWVRRNRRHFAEVTELETTVVERLVEMTRADLRAWLVETDLHLPEGPGQLDDRIAEAVSPAAEGWLSFVRRIAEEQRAPNPWLAEAVLVDSALGGEPSAGSIALFGQDAVTLVDRAARELRGRLEQAYLAVAGSAAALTHTSEAAGRVEELRTAHRAVASRFAAVHA